jgi:Protein of unknown function, DUF481
MRTPYDRIAMLGMLFVLLAAHPAEAREKTDIVQVKNGDRIHGEIVTLQYGRLKLKTDSLGTLSIEWPDVVAVESHYQFYIETVGGRRHFGSFAPDAPAGTVSIAATDEPRSFAVETVTRIDQVEQTFIDRINGSFSVGLNYSKATDISVTSARFESGYRSEFNVASLTAEFNRTSSPDAGVSDRLNLGYVHQYLRPRGRFYIGGTSFERNEELGIDGRLQLAGGVGRFLRQSSISELSIYGGLALNQEWVTGAEDSQQTIEAVLGSNWRIFRFSSPETSLTSSFVVFPGLTEWGRVRTNLNVSLRRELIDDLYLDLSIYHSYDSEPPSEDAATDDYGIVTSLGYSF